MNIALSPAPRLAIPAASKMAIADCDKDVPPVPLDPDGMHQVIVNLLSNALDAVGDAADMG